jgi:hypothetical protein
LSKKKHLAFYSFSAVIPKHLAGGGVLIVAGGSVVGVGSMSMITKDRQTSKIREISETLARVGYPTLDEQAKALGLCRSTAWTIIKSSHKASGLSAHLVNQMLTSSTLPPAVRQKITEYVAERLAGVYGHSSAQRRRFAARLTITLPPGAVEEIREIHRRDTVGTSPGAPQAF